MENETWKDVVGYEGLYQVSNFGRVKSIEHYSAVKRGDIVMNMKKPGRILQPLIRQHGYLGVQLYGRGGHATKNMKTFSIHRLVAEAFIPNPDGLEEVNHINEDKQDNRMVNLEWISHKDNTNFGNTQKKRVATNRVKHNKFIPILQYSINGDFIKRFDSISDAARETHTYAGNIIKCAKGNYTHTGGYVWKYETSY